jgi:hypothetical protein
MNRNPAPLLGPQGIVVLRLRLRTDVLAQVLAQHVEERDEDRQLRDKREAGAEWIDLVLLVELHHLLLLALLVVLVLGLDRLQLRLHPLHLLHRVELLDGQRHEDRAHDDREQDDREAPGDPHVVVEELEDRLEDID